MNPYAPLGPNSGYIPTDDATDGMQVGYSRNITDFRLGQYCLTKPVTRKLGYYRKFNPAVGARLGLNYLTDALWSPGADRPNGLKNQQETNLHPYETIRFNEAVTTDRVAIQQATWSVTDANARNLGQIAMTRRTMMAHAALAGATYGSNTAPVDYAQSGSIVAAKFPGASSGNWGSGTTLQPNFLASMQYAANAITLGTYGALNGNAKNFAVVVNPDTASSMALAPEVQNALIQSPFGKGLLTGNDIDDAIAPYNALWGLPLYYRGFRIVVEDAVYDTTGQPSTNTAGTGAYVMPDNEAYMLYVPNSLKDRVAEADQPDNQEPLYYPLSNSLVMFAFEDFTVEAFESAEHRRVNANVVYDIQFQIPSVLSMFRFTHVTS